MTRRYAQNTTVSVAASRGEITGVLTAHGVEKMAWGTEPSGDSLQFELEGKSFRFTIPKPLWTELEGDYARPWLIDQERAIAQEWRRRWRAYVMLVKMKMEFIEGGDSTLEREFMPYMLVAPNLTLEDAIGAGKVPLLASGG